MGLQLITVREASQELQLFDLKELLPWNMKTNKPQLREAVLRELLRRERSARRARRPMVKSELQWWLRLAALMRDELGMEMTWEIQITFSLYTTCQRRLGSTLDNPYKDERAGFHITFYEQIFPIRQDGSHGLWKTGTLYKKPNISDKHVKNLRHSAFSVVAIKSSRPWKIWLLSHSDFVGPGLPGTREIREEMNTLQNRLGILKSAKIAELACIVWALKQVANRWANLNDYIAELLSDDFMDPESYVKLLSDDAAFSRSKLYFWVIGCLNEFDISIKDNINQWGLFKEKRYRDSAGASTEVSKPASSDSPESPSLQDLLQEADEIRGNLENLRSQFRDQLETAKALRDGLFNASALIESRASTRLAGTVKLLTYVSLFYLPLAFCAALWAIPNITDKSTRNPFIITAVLVGFVTYAIVFNLENIAGLCSRVYLGRRTVLVNQMQHNRSPHWRQRGASLEVFQPNEDHRTASEWWVVAYQVRRWIRQGKWWIKKKAMVGQVGKGDDQSNASAQREEAEVVP